MRNRPTVVLRLFLSSFSCLGGSPCREQQYGGNIRAHDGLLSSSAGSTRPKNLIPSEILLVVHAEPARRPEERGRTCTLLRPVPSVSVAAAYAEKRAGEYGAGAFVMWAQATSCVWLCACQESLLFSRPRLERKVGPPGGAFDLVP